MKRLLVSLLAALVPPASAPVFSATFDGWLVGEPCARELRIADCPLAHADRPVLLLEDGRTLAFLHGDKGVAWDQVDKAYGKKVSLTGEIRDGLLHAVRLDVKEATGEKKFFKGCL
jgi:hypothetical protein